MALLEVLGVAYILHEINKDANKTNYNRNKAITKGYKTYYDSSGIQRMVGTNRKVVTHFLSNDAGVNIGYQIKDVVTGQILYEYNKEKQEKIAQRKAIDQAEHISIRNIALQENENAINEYLRNDQVQKQIRIYMENGFTYIPWPNGEHVYLDYKLKKLVKITIKRCYSSWIAPDDWTYAVIEDCDIRGNSIITDDNPKISIGAKELWKFGIIYPRFKSQWPSFGEIIQMKKGVKQYWKSNIENEKQLLSYFHGDTYNYIRSVKKRIEAGKTKNMWNVSSPVYYNLSEEIDWIMPWIKKNIFK